jgi:hypothetical protein
MSIGSLLWSVQKIALVTRHLKPLRTASPRVLYSTRQLANPDDIASELLTTAKSHEVGGAIPRHLAKIVEVITNPGDGCTNDRLATMSLVSVGRPQAIQTYVVEDHQEQS